jgi:hypothetical protein
LRGKDAEIARQRAIERFGDPAAVACRLWFDAMRGKIMTQRVLVISCIVLTLVSLSLAFLLFNQLVDSQRMAARMQVEMTAQREQSAALQQQMLRELASMSKAAENPRAPDWIPVRFMLRQERSDGLPAQNVHASLGRGRGGSTKPEAIERNSDAQGIVDFGVIQPGDWEYTLSLPFEQGRPRWSAVGTLNALPGTRIENEIVCPRRPLPHVAVKPRVEWPPDLAGKKLVLLASLGHDGLTFESPLRWTAGFFWWHVLCGPDKPQARTVVGQGTLWGLAQLDESVPLSAMPVYCDVRLVGPDRPGSEAVSMEPGTYKIRHLVVLKPSSLPQKPEGDRARFQLVATTTWGGTQTVKLFSQPPDDPDSESNQFQRQETGVRVSAKSWDSISGDLRADEGKVNEWTIRLPDELTAAIRDKLKGELALKEK